MVLYTVAILAKISGSISMIGSFFIIRDVSKSRNQRNENIPMASRVVLSICIADIMSSFWVHFLGTWMVPRWYEDVPLAAGNNATCTAQAFFFDFFIYSGAWSNVSLSITYWLIVCKDMSETRLRKRSWGALLLGLPWSLGSILAVTKAASTQEDYHGRWFCEFGAEIFGYLAYAIIGLGFLLVVFSMSNLIWFVYLTERRMDRFRMDEDAHSRAKTVQATKQGLSYIAVWLVIIVPVFISIPMEVQPDWFLVLFACLFPLQGVLCALVYFRPKYAADRKRTGSSRMNSLMRVLGISIPCPMATLSATVSNFARRNVSVTAVESKNEEANDVTCEDND